MRPAYRSTSRFAVHRLSTMPINRKASISFRDTKNAPRHESAPGPCRYTRQAEIAPSTYASIASRHISASQSLLELWAAIAFVYDCVLDGREDMPWRPASRALEPGDRIFQLGRADAAVECVRVDAMPAFAAVAAPPAEFAIDVFIETPGRQVPAARRLMAAHAHEMSPASAIAILSPIHRMTGTAMLLPIAL